MQPVTAAARAGRPCRLALELLVLFALAGLALLGPVSRAVAAECGDGVVDQNEECDPQCDGGGCPLYFDGNPDLGPCVNGTDCFFERSCCKFNCQFVGQGATCDDGNECTDGSLCNNVGQCTGAVPSPPGSACGDPTEYSPCDLPDICDGDGSCSANPPGPGTDVPGCADGIECTADECDGAGTCVNPSSPPGAPCGDPTTNECDGPDVCDGGGACIANFSSAGTPCGDPSSSACDLPDGCDGAGSCSANFADGQTECRAAVAPCDAAEFCDGSGSCPADVLSTAECRASTDGCDPAELCDGASLTCPPDLILEDGALCEDGDRCTLGGICETGTCIPGPTFLAGRAARFGRRAIVETDVVVSDLAGKAVFQPNSFMVDDTRVSAPIVKLSRGSSVFDVAAGKLINKKGEVRGVSSSPSIAAPTGCPETTFACGGPDFQVEADSVASLPPGAYGDVRIRKDATIEIEEGLYEFCTLRAHRNSVILVKQSAGDGAVIKVERKLQAGENVSLRVEPGAQTPIIHADRFTWGANGDVFAHVFVPDGLFKLGRATVFDGTCCAETLRGNPNSVLGCTSVP